MPKLLDLFCGLGGASAGYVAAGFEVVGVDLTPQPDYPFEFIEMDAMDLLGARGWLLPQGFDLIHASPPCAAYTAINKGTNAGRGDHPRLCEPVREALQDIGIPYVIENPAARADIVLCGEMFGLGVLRHRRFEIGGWSCPQPAHLPHRGRVRGWRHGTHYDGPYVAVYGWNRGTGAAGGGKATAQEARDAMRIPWATDGDQLFQAIPPAFTELIGREFVAQMEESRAAA